MGLGCMHFLVTRNIPPTHFLGQGFMHFLVKKNALFLGENKLPTPPPHFLGQGFMHFLVKKHKKYALFLEEGGGIPPPPPCWSHR